MIDFGYSHVDSTIDTRWIHYAVLPLFAQYNFNAENSIAFGGTVSYLVNTSSIFKTGSTDAFGMETAGISKRSFGYMQGFNPINATLAVAYRRRISNKISVSAEAHYGLFDVKDNTFFSRQKFERSSGIKFIISYDLFNH